MHDDALFSFVWKAFLRHPEIKRNICSKSGSKSEAHVDRDFQRMLDMDSEVLEEAIELWRAILQQQKRLSFPNDVDSHETLRTYSQVFIPLWDRLFGNKELEKNPALCPIRVSPGHPLFQSVQCIFVRIMEPQPFLIRLEKFEKDAFVSAIIATRSYVYGISLLTLLRQDEEMPKAALDMARPYEIFRYNDAPKFTNLFVKELQCPILLFNLHELVKTGKNWQAVINILQVFVDFSRAEKERSFYTLLRSQMSYVPMGIAPHHIDFHEFSDVDKKKQRYLQSFEGNIVFYMHRMHQLVKERRHDVKHYAELRQGNHNDMIDYLSF